MQLGRSAVSRFMYALFTVAALMLGLAAILALFNSFDRKVLTIGFPWIEEFCTYMIVMGVFLTLPLIELRDDQLHMGLLSSLIESKAFNKALFIFRGLFTITILSIIVWYGIITVQAQASTGAVTIILRWPKATIYSVGVAGYAMAIISWLTIFLLNKGEKVDVC